MEMFQYMINKSYIVKKIRVTNCSSTGSYSIRRDQEKIQSSFEVHTFKWHFLKEYYKASFPGGKEGCWNFYKCQITLKRFCCVFQTCFSW